MNKILAICTSPDKGGLELYFVKLVNYYHNKKLPIISVCQDDSLISKIIRSPTFNIMINYPLKDFQIFHYDLYRIKNINEIHELDIYENVRNNITLIEWPEIIFKNSTIKKYYKIDFKIESINKRKIDIVLNDT